MPRTRATRTAAVAVVTALAGSAPLAGPVAAQQDARPLDDRDAVGDVRILSPGASVRMKVRRSIDIEHVRATERSNGVRFSVDVRRYLPTSRAVDQIVAITLTPVDEDLTAFSQVTIGWSAQPPRWKAYISAQSDDADAGRACTPNRIASKPKTGVLSIDVPTRCLPVGRARVELVTSTGTFATDAPTYSRDRLAVGPRLILEPPPRA